MKKYLKSVPVILFMIAFTEMHAQIKSGQIIGFNMSTMTLKTTDTKYDQEMSTGIHIGGIVDIPLKAGFTLKPGFLFSAKGSTYKIDTVKFSISPIYIEIPVIAVYSFGIDAVKISLFCGPYFAIGIGGNILESGSELKKINFGSGDNDDLRLFDTGLNFGVGVNIKGLLISAQYGIGLYDVSPVTTVDTDMKNKVIGIAISSLFAGK